MRDPLTQILRLAEARSVVSGELKASGSWALKVPAPEQIKFMAVVKGGCWLHREGKKKPTRIEAGDVIFHSEPRSFVLYNDPDVDPVDAQTLYENLETPVVVLGKGDAFHLIGGHVNVDPAFAEHLSDLFPKWLHLQGIKPEAKTLRWLLEQLVFENTSSLPGADSAAAQLAQLMFIQVLRSHLGSAKPSAPGLFRILGDPKLAPAVRLIHNRPEEPWQLEELAKAAGMSRTTFAVYFKSVAGISPLAYLSEWRMQVARKMLRQENVTIAILAESLGYASESAFSSAFKRVTGLAPKHYRTSTGTSPVSQSHRESEIPI